MSRIEDALDLIDLEDWSSVYEKTIPGSDSEFRVENCPKCGNSNFKLYVNSDKLLWNCFVCSWGKGQGDICAFMAAISGRHINDIKIELVQTVVPTPANSDELVQKLNPTEKEIEVPVIEPVEVPGTASFDGIMGKKVLKYALSRGLSEDLVKSLKLGNTFTIEDKKKKKGPFLVFPVYYYNIPVSWQGRKVGKSKPKYVSSKNIHSWLFPINSEYIRIISSKKKVYLVEGVFDALALWKAGYPGLCTFGKGLKSNQIKLLKQHGIDEIYVSYDVDAAGQVGSIAKEISSHFSNVYVVNFGYDTEVDPGDYLTDDSLYGWLVESLENPIKLEMSAKIDSLADWDLKRLLDG